MRLEAEGAPNPMDSFIGKTAASRHGTGAPMSGLLWLGLQSQSYDFGNLLIADLPRSPATRQIEKAFQAHLIKASSQRAHGLGTQPGLGASRFVIHAFS